MRRSRGGAERSPDPVQSDDPVRSAVGAGSAGDRSVGSGPGQNEAPSSKRPRRIGRGSQLLPALLLQSLVALTPRGLVVNQIVRGDPCRSRLRPQSARRAPGAGGGGRSDLRRPRRACLDGPGSSAGWHEASYASSSSPSRPSLLGDSLGGARDRGGEPVSRPRPSPYSCPVRAASACRVAANGT